MNRRVDVPRSGQAFRGVGVNRRVDDRNRDDNDNDNDNDRDRDLDRDRDRDENNNDIITKEDG